jgi:hypothetical protein
VVRANAADYTPELVPSSAVPQPHVDAIAINGDTVYAAGRFDTVKHGNTTHTGMRNIVAFDRVNGQVKTAFQPQFPDDATGQIWALATDPATGDLYVGGDFATVNGASRSGLVKVDGITGATVTSFNPYFKVGKVKDLRLMTLGGLSRLVVAGGMAQKLITLDPATGARDLYISSTIAEPIPNAWGGVMVYSMAINPAGTRLVATGNFQTVDGQPRARFFMMDLATGATSRKVRGATLSDWYYSGFAKPCASTHPRRIAYLQGIDWSPDGTHFTVAATGQIPLNPSEVWHWWNTPEEQAGDTVCDAAGRFALADQTRPVWVNYTGGDSIWSVADTGAAVYVQGHFKWLDNPDGFASSPARWDGDGCPAAPTWPQANQVCAPIGDLTTGAEASRRAGIGAIDPTTGQAIATWKPGMPVKMGGKALLATSDPVSGGLWIGSDSAKFGPEQHRGIAFAPLR